MHPLRIYADFNGLARGPANPARTAVMLSTFGSLRDLSNAGIVLRTGLALIVTDDAGDGEDLEGHGTAQFDPEQRRWVVELDEHGVRYVPARDHHTLDEFRCANCRAPIDGVTCLTVWQPDQCCPRCGTSLLAALAAPSDAA